MKGDIFIFPVADGTVKISGEDQVLRTSTMIRDSPERGEERKDLRGESDGSPPPQDSLPGDGEARNDFWSISGNYIYRHHVEPRVKLYSPREESFPIPLKYIDVSRTTRTNLDVKQEKRIDDYWNIDGSVKTTPQMTRFRDVQQALIMATVWIDDDKTESDNNIKKKTWDFVCVVKPNDKTSDTNDNVTTKTNTVHMKRDTWQVSVHVVFLFVRVVVIFTHCTPHRVAQVVRVFELISSMHDLSVTLSTLSSPFHPSSSSHSPSISRSSYCPSTSTRISGNIVYSANKEMESTGESYTHTGYEPKDYYFTETYVESLTESLTQQQFPEQRFLEDVDYDDAALEEMLHNGRRVHVYHSQREGLSVGQSSSSVSERTVRLVVERTGRPVVASGQELNTEHAQIRTLLDRQREQILADCQAEIKKTRIPG